MEEKKLILVPRFTDRSGRTVYDIHQDDPRKRVCSPGIFVGQLRMCLEEAKPIDLELVNNPNPWPVVDRPEPDKASGTG